MRESEQPKFVASNMIRAVQTMVHAAPGQPIIIQPLVREIGCDASRLERLAGWARDNNVVADFQEYKKLLDAEAGNEQGRPGGELLTVCDACNSLSELIDWFGTLEADTVFVASHGGLLATLDHVSYSAVGLMCGLFTCSIGYCDHLRNCEVREYRLMRRRLSNGWCIRKVA